MLLIRFRPEQFPLRGYSKLYARRAGPFPNLKKLGVNAYVLDLFSTYNIGLVFNIEDLTEYQGDFIDNEPSENSVIRIPTVPVMNDKVSASSYFKMFRTRVCFVWDVLKGKGCVLLLEDLSCSVWSCGGFGS
ncbi:hypothetical protein ACOSQ4_007147 [Xanthoceras sorbifolium]